MAVFFRNMTLDERVALTEAMRDSGTVLDWSDLGGPVVDKHFDRRRGRQCEPDAGADPCGMRRLCADDFWTRARTYRRDARQVRLDPRLHDAAGQRAVPQGDQGSRLRHHRADGRPRAGRQDPLFDPRRTGTVENISLITASILSKKLAAGLHALILDVKTGSGAFMPTLDKSRELAESLWQVVNGARHRRRAALITDMNEPLASAAGNALEIRNAVDFLTGKHRDHRLMDVTLGAVRCGAGAHGV